MQANVQILAVDGTPAPDWETINMLLATKLGESSVQLSVSPFGSSVEQYKVLDLTNWRFNPEKQSAFDSLGIEPVRTKVEMRVSNVAENSPAARAGILIGDQLFKEDGSSMNGWNLLKLFKKVKRLSCKLSERVNFFKILLQPELNAKKKYYVGISPTVQPIANEYQTEIKYDMLDSLLKGVENISAILADNKSYR